MRKHFSKIFIAFVLTLVLVPSVKAVGPTFKYSMEDGIGNVTVYIDAAGTPRATYWQRLLKDAIHNWMYTGYGANPFYATYVSSNVGSKMDIYAKYDNYWEMPYPNVYVLAETEYYTRAISEIKPDDGIWFSATILLNDDRLRQDSISDEQATGTFIHEIGHAFGLAHWNTNVNSIMCQSYVAASGLRRQVQTVQRVDNETLNSKYN